MIPLSATQGYSALLTRLSDSAVVELDRLMGAVAAESPAVQREALMDLLPALGEEYVGASSLVSAQFFTELQEIQQVAKPIAAESLPGVGAKRWHALAGWGTQGSMFEQGGAQLVYSLLSGGLTKILTEVSADTMFGNAAIQGGMRSQRVPAPGCCAFCGMLASRFAGYTSGKSAGVVVGRGTPVGKHRLAKGIRPRGSRAAGEKFHDFCRCRVVTVTEGNEVQLQAQADKYYDAYRDAYDKVDEGLVHTIIDGKTEWVESATGKKTDAKSRVQMITSSMRKDLSLA